MIPISALLRSSGDDSTELDRCPFGVKGRCVHCRAWQAVAFATRYELGVCLRMLPPDVDWDLAEPVERPNAMRLLTENKE